MRSRPASMKACGAPKPPQASSCMTSSIAWAATELQAYWQEAIKTVLPTDISGSRPPSRSAPGGVADGAARHAGQRTGQHVRRPHRPMPTSRRRPTARRRPRRIPRPNSVAKESGGPTAWPTSWPDSVASIVHEARQRGRHRWPDSMADLKAHELRGRLQGPPAAWPTCDRTSFSR